jgi:hypothetical protein
MVAYLDPFGLSVQALYQLVKLVAQDSAGIYEDPVSAL